MCILTFFTPGSAPDLDALNNGALANPDGHGYAVLTGTTTITVGHGLDGAAVLAEFAAVRERFPEGPALFHSRLATHGRHDLSNCHPFPIGGDVRTVLAHNGILPSHVHPQRGDQRSDTRIAAEDFLPREPFGPWDSWAGRAHLERWLGTDKMVILTVDPAYQRRAYIFNEHLGIWDNGTWYSNTSYLPFDDEGEEWAGYCLNCGQPTIADTADELDETCQHCAWCGFCTPLPPPVSGLRLRPPRPYAPRRRHLRP
ncbi:hypothetical protein IU443_12990 [Nocardia farcinica]|uniref:hypothetical protein n=1 Tax=Nocardia farcinica TaxID=37329 RepID=UPI0018935F87|nr:hypothetical protein [Nocardia farcinica]MBF6262471.1 hypothetical protein [Nocardia farcinica]MBF6284382.1 hypothetical protein [Nocardia farcinica]MBF6308882.1 hypothetical protein [Nocardia farcinica]MBF6390865.1 hypothetical protein [Nocardia farcinica]MBF6526220.1 hypothetical protein [Nocardia farcinica]